jgi:hypothetical protein
MEGSFWKTLNLVKVPKYLGYVGRTKRYGVFTTLDYLGGGKYLVEFDNGYRTSSSIKELTSNRIKNPTFISLYGVGYIGVGEAKATYIDPVGIKRNVREYEVWYGMLSRCYNENNVRYQLYGGKGVTVCKDWHNFQNFNAWYKLQPSRSKNYDLDKDILYPNSRLYSPTTCTLVPNQINSLFSGGRSTGVTFNKSKSKWVVQIHDGVMSKEGKPKQSYYGSYKNYEEAREISIRKKVLHIIEVAETWKSEIDPAVYTNLTNVSTIMKLMGERY